MLDFDTCFKLILSPAFEGDKFTNTPGDYGGATKAGLTQRNYDKFREHGQVPKQSVELATFDELKIWYEQYCWINSGCDNILAQGKDKLAFTVFNCSVQRGDIKAIKILQSVLGLPVPTGYCGPLTLWAISEQEEQLLIVKYLRSMVDYFVDHVTKFPDQKKFLKGWLNRINHVAEVVESNYRVDGIRINGNI